MSIWTKIVSFFDATETEVDTVFNELEQRLLPGLAALAKQIEATIGEQGLTILEQGLEDIGTVIASGGNVGAAISALVPQVTAQVKDDLKQDATNAAHGAVSLIIASLPKPAAVVEGTSPTVA
jgi:hypothetical protein